MTFQACYKNHTTISIDAAFHDALQLGILQTRVGCQQFQLILHPPSLTYGDHVSRSLQNFATLYTSAWNADYNSIFNLSNIYNSNFLSTQHPHAPARLCSHLCSRLLALHFPTIPIGSIRTTGCVVPYEYQQVDWRYHASSESNITYEVCCTTRVWRQVWSSEYTMTRVHTRTHDESLIMTHAFTCNVLNLVPLPCVWCSCCRQEYITPRHYDMGALLLKTIFLHLNRLWAILRERRQGPGCSGHQLIDVFICASRGLQLAVGCSASHPCYTDLPNVFPGTLLLNRQATWPSVSSLPRWR